MGKQMSYKREIGTAQEHVTSQGHRNGGVFADRLHTTTRVCGVLALLVSTTLAVLLAVCKDRGCKSCYEKISNLGSKLEHKRGSSKP